MGITRGAIDLPPILAIHGDGGVGKTMFAAGAPNPVFIQTEAGTNQLDVARHPVARSYAEFMGNLNDADNAEYDTIVVDSLSCLEPLIWAEACKRDGVAMLNQVHGGYQHEWEGVAEVWNDVLYRLEQYRDQGKIIMLISHTSSVKIRQADMEAYNRFQPDLHNSTTDQIFRWCDAMFFAYFKKSLVGVDKDIKKENTRKIAVGNNQRGLRCIGTPSILAKSRYDGMPEEVDLSWDAVAPYFTVKQ